MVSLSSFFYLLLLQQIFQVIIARDALQFLLHNLLHLFLDTPVVRLHRFFHAVVAVLVREIGNDREFSCRHVPPASPSRHPPQSRSEKFSVRYVR